MAPFFDVILRHILYFLNTENTAQDTGEQTGLDNNDFHEKVSFRQFKWTAMPIAISTNADTGTRIQAGSIVASSMPSPKAAATSPKVFQQQII